MGRMNILIALKTLIPKIPLGILKKAEFHDGLMPVFLTGMDRNYISLKHCTRIYTNNIQVSYAPHSCVKRCQNGVSRHL